MTESPEPVRPSRIMVDLSDLADDERLLRTANQYAGAQGTWFAVYIESGRPLGDEERRRLASQFDLARSFGATVITTSNPDRAATLLNLARQHQVTRLLLPRESPLSPARRLLAGLRQNRLLDRSGDLEIIFLPDRRPAPHPPNGLAFEKTGWRHWLMTLMVLTLVTILGIFLEPTLGAASVQTLYLLTLIVASLFLGRVPIMLLAIGSAMAWWFFILPQQFSLRVSRLEDGLMLGLFFASALVIGHIASVFRIRERAGLEGERTARALYDLLRSLNDNRDLGDGGLQNAVSNIEGVFQAPATLLCPSPDGFLEARPPGPFSPSPSDLILAAWALQHRKWAGRWTDHFPECPVTFIPLYAGGVGRGILAIQLPEEMPWDILQRELLDSMSTLLAQMMERDENGRKAKMTEIAVESQKLQRALLDNVSHEMHTPISILAGALQHLDQTETLPAETRMVLGEARIAVERLNLVVRDLVDLARIECGTLRPSLEWCDTADFLQEWMEDKNENLAQRLRLRLPEKPVYIRIDTRLMTTALDNIIHNAFRHAPADTPVEIRARSIDDRLHLEITDQGPGIPPDQAERIFDRFYRGPGAKPGGLGLGLPVARQFTELMGGTLTAEPLAESGACFLFTFPCASKLSLAEEPAP